MTEPLDLDEIKPWLALCGYCDAGLPMLCTHPDGDYRPVMARLVAEVERLRATNAELVRDAVEWVSDAHAERRIVPRNAVRRTDGAPEETT